LACATWAVFKLGGSLASGAVPETNTAIGGAFAALVDCVEIKQEFFML